MPNNRTTIFRAALYLGFALSIPFGTCAEPRQRPVVHQRPRLPDLQPHPHRR
jgi:hypothetical protein